MSDGASNRSFNSDIDPERWDLAFGRESAPEPEPRLERPHTCEHCGHQMKYADQQCACTSRKP